MKKQFFLPFFLLSLFIQQHIFAQNNHKGIDVQVVSDKELIINVKPSGFQLKNVAEGNLVALENATSLLQEGAPDIQKLAYSFIIPDNALMKVEVLAESFSEIQNVNLLPSKGNLSRTLNPADIPYKKGAIYQKNEFFPAKLAELQKPYILRDFRAQTVWVYPIQYNPATKTLRVYKNISLKISSEGLGGENVFTRHKPLKSIDREFGQIYQHQFLNAESVLNYTPVSEEGEMLIICHDAFATEMQPFVEWKKQKGISVTMVNTSVSGSTTTAVKNYITNFYNSHNLKYVLLVGDNAQIPTGAVGNNPSDNQYVYLAGNDAYPECFIGRFSAEQAVHVNTQVTRNLMYEKTPNTALDYYHKGVVIGSDQGPGDDNQYDWQHEREIGQNLLTYNYTDMPELFDGSQGGADAPGDPDATDVTAIVDAGVGIFNYTGHGGSTSLVTSNFSNPNVDLLKNAGKYPFMWIVGCVTGEFMNTTCFAEKWARAKDNSNNTPTGSIANFMSTINQSWDPPMQGQDAMNDILRESVSGNIKRTFGGLSFNGCMDMNDAYGAAGDEMTDTWTIFGDPSLMVWTNTPATMTVTHAPNALLGIASFVVNVSQNATLVCLTQNGEILGTAVVNGGVATVNFPALTNNSDITITVTGYNQYPYIATIPVLTPTTAYVVSQSILVNDATTGNNNTLADYNETIKLTANIINVGPVTANNAVVTISSTSSYVNITDNIENAGNINGNATLTLTDAFELNVAANVPDLENINLSINITDANGGSWTTPATFVANAPKLQPLQFSIDDTQGNNNGIIDAGETVLLTIHNANNGHSQAQNAVGTLTCNVPDITIANANFAVGNLAVNATGDALFSVTAANNIIAGGIATFHYQIAAGAYNGQNDYTLKIAPKYVDFEPASQAIVTWQNAGNQNWFATNSQPFQAQTCYQSGDITDNQTSEMFFSWTVAQNDSLIFYRKVDCEKDWDYLVFYIDGVEAKSWTGNEDWTRFAVEVSAGLHEFRWSYNKDNLYSAGADAAWVDYIILPASAVLSGLEDKNELENMFSLFPNPAQNTLNIQYEVVDNEEVGVELYNAAGQLLASPKPFVKGKGVYTEKLDLRGFAAGVYVVKVKIGDKTSAKKVMLLR